MQHYLETLRTADSVKLWPKYWIHRQDGRSLPLSLEHAYVIKSKSSSITNTTGNWREMEPFLEYFLLLITINYYILVITLLTIKHV